MNTKLTLTIEESTIQKAKSYAKEQGRSLSSIIENYLELITAKKGPKEKKTGPIVKSLRGSFKLPENFDYKKELEEILTEKYLKS